MPRIAMMHPPRVTRARYGAHVHASYTIWHARAMGIRRIGLLGDIHTEDARLEHALAEMKRAQVDAIVSVGDIVDGPGDVERCVRLLAQHDVIAVKGNHDRWFVRGDFVNDADRRIMGWTVSGALSTASFAWLT